MCLDTSAAWRRTRFFWPSPRGLKVCAFLVFVLGILAATGCGSRNDISKPPKIQYGRDICSQCRMIIQDERFACAAVSAEGRFLKFDDIGCLAAFERTQNGRELLSWVHDAGTDRWLEKKQAHFVHSPDLVTPMGYGFAAFADRQDVMRFVQEKTGQLVTWDNLIRRKFDEN